MMYVLTIYDADGWPLFWFECDTREAGELERDYFEAHGIDADLDSGPRRMVECRHDPRLRRRPEHVRARAHRLAAQG